jgi:hypothetical protein
MLYISGGWNYVNGVAGILNILLICGWSGIFAYVYSMRPGKFILFGRGTEHISNYPRTLPGKRNMDAESSRHTLLLDNVGNDIPLFLCNRAQFLHLYLTLCLRYGR